MKIEKRHRLNYALAILVAALAAVYFLMYLYHGISIIRFPFNWEWGEGIQLYWASSLLQGQLYTPLDDYPFILCPHPPLYPAMVAALMPLLGETLFAGRLPAFLASLLIGFLIYRIVKGETRNTYLGAVSALLFFASNFVYEWAGYFMSNMPAVLFGITGVFVAYKYRDSRKIYLAIIPLVLAIYTRQYVGIVSSITVVIFLLLTNKKMAVKMALALLLCGGGIFLPINLLTHGEFFRHILLYPAGFRGGYTTMLYHSFRFFTLHAVLLGFAATYLLLSIRRRQPSVWSIYFLVSLAITTFVARQGGTGSYYYFEAIALCCILTGLCIDKLVTEFKPDLSKASVVTLLLCMLVMQLALFIHFPPRFDPQSDFPGGGQTPTSADLRVMAEVNQYVQATPGKVHIEEIGFAVQNNKEVWIEVLSMDIMSHPRAKAALKRFIADIENKEFSLMVFSHHYLPDEIAQAIESNYELIKKIPVNYGAVYSYAIYVPKGKPD